MSDVLDKFLLRIEALLAAGVHLQPFLLVGAILFATGVFTVLTRRNAVAVLMGVELILNAAALNFVAFSRFVVGNLEGHVFAIFIILLAAAEAAVALGIVIGIYKSVGTVDLEETTSLRG